MKQVHMFLAFCTLLMIAQTAICRPHVFKTPLEAQYEFTPVPDQANTWDLDLIMGDGPSTFRVVRSTPDEIVILRNVSVLPIEDISIVLAVVDFGTFNRPLEQIDSIIFELPSQASVPLPHYLYVNNVYVAGNLGSIHAHHINLLRVGGSITGLIRVDTYELEYVGINVIEVLNGDITGNISVKPLCTGVECYAGVEEIVVSSGVIGDPQGPPISLKAGYFGSIKAQSVNAIIDNHPQFGSTFTLIELLECLDNAGGSGNLDGELYMGSILDHPSLERGLRIDDELNATVIMGRLSDEGYDNGGIVVGTNGLKGTIIIDAPALPNAWTGPVKIGTGETQIVLDGDSTSYPAPGEYPITAESVGDGTVGLVPFRLHRTDCTPVHATTIEPSSIEDTITMRHYGPVYWNSGDGQPYQVHRRKIGSTTDTWQLQDCFTCTLDSTNNTKVHVSTTSVDRLQRGFEYRVSLRTRISDNQRILRCALPHLATTAYPQVANFDPLTFKICDTLPIQSPGDADDDGDVDEDDASCVLANWNSTACMKYGDANRDGGVNLADVYEVDEYQGWCYCLFCELSVSSGGGNGKTTLGFAPDDDHGGATALSAPPAVAEALEIMGYSSIESFVHIVYMMDESARFMEYNRLADLLGE